MPDRDHEVRKDGQCLEEGRWIRRARVQCTHSGIVNPARPHVLVLQDLGGARLLASHDRRVHPKELVVRHRPTKKPRHGGPLSARITGAKT